MSTAAALSDAILRHVSGLVNEGTDIARICRELVLLKDDVPVDRPLDSFAVQEQEPETLLPFLREQGFKSIVARLESRMADAGNGIADAAPTEVSYELVQDEDALARFDAPSSLYFSWPASCSAAASSQALVVPSS